MGYHRTFTRWLFLLIRGSFLFWEVQGQGLKLEAGLMRKLGGLGFSGIVIPGTVVV